MRRDERPARRLTSQQVGLVGVGLLVGVFLLILATSIFSSKDDEFETSSTLSASPNPEAVDLTPTQVPSEIFMSLRDETVAAISHPFTAVRDNALKLLDLLDGKPVTWPDCSSVQVYAELHLFNEYNADLLLGIQPNSVGYNQEGGDILLEWVIVDPEFWFQIPEGRKWSFLWHETEHIHQDCVLLEKTIKETGLKEAALLAEFLTRWEAGAVENELVPVAVQMYWHRHYEVVDYVPLFDQLLRQFPTAFQMELPMGPDGIPLGIEAEAEGSIWRDLISSYYVVRSTSVTATPAVE
jgi:hypothetical protein